MALYVDRGNIKDVEHITSDVFRYLITKHKKEVRRLSRLHRYYMGKHDIFSTDKEDEEKVRVNSNYAKYVVDVVQGYYLGEPVKYNGTEEKVKTTKTALNSGVDATVKNGAVSVYDWKQSKEIDISRLVDVYKNQSISEADAKIGKQLGIYGVAYELEYSNMDEIPEPRTTVIDARNCIMVRDTTVEHNKLFSIVYDIQEDLNENKYYYVTVYTDKTSKDYKSRDLENFEFHFVDGSEKEHFFGEVPVVEYQNDDERQGDFEQVIPLIDGLNELLSDRITDKKKFVNSLLAMYGITLEEDDIKVLNKERFLDGIPLDARIEYVQKVFDEGSMNVLCNDIIREIHKMTLTVDMTDDSFAGNSSGQALMLKLMTMNMLVKNKMRSFEKGLKKRFEMYNYWLTFKGEMEFIDKKDVDVVFTVLIPTDKQEILSTVTQLQGIVDKKTLLSQLWFIKDVDEAYEAIEKQTEEERQKYMDSLPNDDFEEGTEETAEETAEEEGSEEDGLQEDDDKEGNTEEDSNKENSIKGKGNKAKM